MGKRQVFTIDVDDVLIIEGPVTGVEIALEDGRKKRGARRKLAFESTTGVKVTRRKRVDKKSGHCSDKSSQ